MNQSVVNEHQPSLTEWFAAIGQEKESEALRAEDNTKVNRLEQLFQAIALPYERPIKLPARALTEEQPEFQALLKSQGDQLCAIRLVPLKEGLPKLRNRGLSLRETYESWFKQQAINPDEYEAHIYPHTNDLLWSAIFVVGEQRVVGELIEGKHAQLTQGTTTHPTYDFNYDFSTWQWSASNSEAATAAESMLNALLVDSKEKQAELNSLLSAQFSHNYLRGYFEAVIWPDGNLYFIDYNRLLEKYLPSGEGVATITSTNALRGVGAFAGRVSGPVKVVGAEAIATADFLEGDILVCDNTDVRYLPLMKKAGAIVTERGGRLSHAAIIARELGKPCVVGACSVTEKLHSDQMVTVDGATGSIELS